MRSIAGYLNDLFVVGAIAGQSGIERGVPLSRQTLPSARKPTSRVNPRKAGIRAFEAEGLRQEIARERAIGVHPKYRNRAQRAPGDVEAWERANRENTA